MPLPFINTNRLSGPIFTQELFFLQALIDNGFQQFYAAP